ncbi:MAG: hypothetical protein IPP83_20035 [Flavobacteriales bacterium]|nr:hypothetical protein [Flavobacteriales bacterium]
MRTLITRYPVLILSVLVLGIQFGIVLVTAHLLPEGVRLRDAPLAHSIFRLRVFWPLVLAVGITFYLEGRSGVSHLFSAYRVWRVPVRFYAFAFSWKFLFCYLAWVIMDLAGILEWPGALVANFFDGDHHQFITMLYTMPFIIGIALVEETTWMKFCVTRLQARYTAFTACVLTGLAWGLWYLPMLLLGEGVPEGYPWYAFLVSMIGLTLLLGWTYNRTHSGIVLLIMQVVSNIAFFVLPALPAWHDMDPSYVIGFIVVEIGVVIYLVLRYGPRDLGTEPRPVWKVPQPVLRDPSFNVSGTTGRSTDPGF